MNVTPQAEVLADPQEKYVLVGTCAVCGKSAGHEFDRAWAEGPRGSRVYLRDLVADMQKHAASHPFKAIGTFKFLTRCAQCGGTIAVLYAPEYASRAADDLHRLVSDLRIWAARHHVCGVKES